MFIARPATIHSGRTSCKKVEKKKKSQQFFFIVEDKILIYIWNCACFTAALHFIQVKICWNSRSSPLEFHRWKLLTGLSLETLQSSVTFKEERARRGVGGGIRRGEAFSSLLKYKIVPIFCYMYRKDFCQIVAAHNLYKGKDENLFAIGKC